METRRRSFIKALSWRVVATVITMAITWGVTGTPSLALKIGALDTTIKFAAYFLHERMWLRISYGREVSDYQI